MAAKGWLSRLARNALIFLCLSIVCSDILAAIGRTPGSVSVSPTGAAQYHVPIWTPPGAGGMRPELALSYDHFRPNGLLGMGFEIAGLSSIRRCAKTIAQDGIDAGITLANTDVFCLDRNRLRLASAGTYGAPGTTYRTELDTFAKITANSSAGTGPGWFEVRAKNGLIYEYGNSTDSRITLGGSTAREWALSS